MFFSCVGAFFFKDVIEDLGVSCIFWEYIYKLILISFRYSILN